MNGEPFTRYLLRTLYHFAHEIIVVEGACPGAVASGDGHSLDRTVEVLQEFKEREDPEDKVVIVQRDGLWAEKTEQSQAFAQRATGDYLWICDIDEFYTPDMLAIVVGKLRDHPEIDMLSFGQVTFWGGIQYVADSYIFRRGWWRDGVARVFKWKDGYTYVNHRPVVIADAHGTDLRKGLWLRRRDTERWGVRMLHYSLLFPQQVVDKCRYYQAASWNGSTEATEWARTCWIALEHPFRVHNVYQSPSWLERYDGVQPPQILAMMEDVAKGVLQVETRRTDDIEALLDSRSYHVARLGVRAAEPLDRLRCVLARGTARVARGGHRRIIRPSTRHSE